MPRTDGRYIRSFPLGKSTYVRGLSSKVCHSHCHHHAYTGPTGASLMPYSREILPDKGKFCHSRCQRIRHGTDRRFLAPVSYTCFHFHTAQAPHYLTNHDIIPAKSIHLAPTGSPRSCRRQRHPSSEEYPAAVSSGDLLVRQKRPTTSLQAPHRLTGCHRLPCNAEQSPPSPPPPPPPL